MRQSRFRGKNDEYYQLLHTPPIQRTYKWRSGSHDRRRNFSGSLPLVLHCVSPVYVGTGDYELDSKDGIYLSFARRNGRLFVPGTTIKGVVRSYAEALSPSCETKNRCDLSRDDVHAQLCPACAIFGALGFQGRVTLCDTAALPEETATQKPAISVRWSGKIPIENGRRFYHHNLPGFRLKKEDDSDNPDERVEVVPKDTQFQCSLLFDNLKQEEMGLLLLALGVSPAHRFSLKLGGGKDRTLGSVRFEASEGILLQHVNSYEQFDDGTQTETVGAWGKAAIDQYLALLAGQNSEWREWVDEAVKCFQDDNYMPEAGDGYAQQ